MDKANDAPDGFSQRDGYGLYRLAGEHTFDDTIDGIDTALSYCCDQEVERLLVDISEVTGFPPPTVAQRFEFATRWAATAAGRVKLAIIAPESLIDPEKIGTTMANNRGLVSDAFTTTR
jgi:hypothetical protein